MESILTSVKKMLGLEEDFVQFDPDIIFSINTTFMFLNQIGVGPDGGFSILDKEATWSDYLGEETNMESVKSFVYLKVRLIFDPPSSASVLDAYERLLKELEWRLNVEAEKPEVEEGDV